LSGVATEMLERVSKEGGNMEQGDKSVIGLLSMSLFVCIFSYPFNLLIFIFCGWMEMTNEINFILQHSQIFGRKHDHENYSRGSLDPSRCSSRTCQPFTYPLVLDEHAPPSRIRNHLNQFDGTPLS
jgi:hypothetical protein